MHKEKKEEHLYDTNSFLRARYLKCGHKAPEIEKEEKRERKKRRE